MIFRTLKRPTTIKAQAVTEDAIADLKLGEMHSVGTDLEAGSFARQLDIYYRDNKTLVLPLDGPAELKPWLFTGYVSPLDCRTHYVATVGDTAKET